MAAAAAYRAAASGASRNRACTMPAPANRPTRLPLEAVRRAAGQHRGRLRAGVQGGAPMDTQQRVAMDTARAAGASMRIGASATNGRRRQYDR